MSASLTAAFPHTVAPGDLAAVPRLLVPALGEAAALAADEGCPIGDGPARWEWEEPESEGWDIDRVLAAAAASDGPFPEDPVLTGPGPLIVCLCRRLGLVKPVVRWRVFLEEPERTEVRRSACRAVALALRAREILYGPDWFTEFDEFHDYDSLRESLLAKYGPPAPSLDIVRRLHDARQEAWREAEQSCPSHVETWWHHPDAVAAREERDSRYERAWRAIRARFGCGEYFVERVD